jgi:hypothetical protein
MIFHWMWNSQISEESILPTTIITHLSLRKISNYSQIQKFELTNDSFYKETVMQVTDVPQVPHDIGMRISSSPINTWWENSSFKGVWKGHNWF